MNLTLSFPSFHSRVEELLEKLLPKRFKRMFVFATLTSQLGHERRINLSTLARLNELMLLSEAQPAVSLPSFIASAQWEMEGRAPQTLIPTLNDPRILSIIRKVPAWLRYDSEAEIQREIVFFLNFTASEIGDEMVQHV